MSVINTNLSSLNAQRSLSTSQSDLNTSIQRLSSGLRINSAKDDAAGLSIATKMDTQIRGMNQAIRNANDGISLAQTADGALSTMNDAMQRMRELAVQGANSTNGADEAANLDKEFQALAGEINRISSTTKFNGISLFNASGSTSNVDLSIQIGANNGETVSIKKEALVSATDLSVTGTDKLTLSATAAVVGPPAVAAKTAAENASNAIDKIDAALKAITTQRAELGAAQNRFGYAVSNLQSSVENQSAAKSRIMDTDFAAETAKMTRGQILQQAGTAMLAQANQLPNGVMALLRG